MRKSFLIALPVLLFLACGTKKVDKIDRNSLVERNNPHVTTLDSLASLSVGNGNFAFTVDATGLQTFPEAYANGIPLGTQSQWGWHSFSNPNHYKFEETLKEYEFRGRKELYSVQFNEPGRHKEAADWYRVNPHRLHLGNIGFEIINENGALVPANDIQSIDQTLDLWQGIIKSKFQVNSSPVAVETSCDPKSDQIGVRVNSPLMTTGKLKINFRFSYPTGKHSDDACDRTVPDKHKTTILSQDTHSVIFKRQLDSTVYYVTVKWEGKATVTEKEAHYFTLNPEEENLAFTCEFTKEKPLEQAQSVAQTFDASSTYWQNFWERGGAVDFSKATDSRAKELERRVVLSQYLMAIQSAGMYPPQETGLTYNSWFGKFHLEMHWWHAVHFALWNRIDLLERSMDWYSQAYPIAKSIAKRQGYDGARWMKMTDPSGVESPSKVGSFLIWQQPHFIYMAELIYRNNPSDEVIKKYGFLVQSCVF